MITTIVGARPQLVKASVVSAALEEAGVAERLVHTGQHFDPNMSEIFFNQLDMRAPSANLGISGGTHAQMTAQMLTAIEDDLAHHRPDVLIVYGDTNSTLAAALAASKIGVPVAHVEAGLRSYNRAMPEEVNRVVTDHLASHLFTPTDMASQILVKEGIDPASVLQVGDVMYDAVLAYSNHADKAQVLESLDLEVGGFVLATIHRSENTDHPERLGAIMAALAELARDLPVLIPMHPRTVAQLGDEAPGGLRVIEPVGYLEMLALTSTATLVCTDSGGLQKEAFFQRVPCVTLRDETEWTELIDSKWNRLAPPTSVGAIAAVIRDALDGGPGDDVSPYGDGTAAVLTAKAMAGTYG